MGCAYPRLEAGRWRKAFALLRSYGKPIVRVQTIARLAAVVGAAWLAGLGIAGDAKADASRPVKIVALGDSLVAGLGLPASQTFPVRMQRALAAEGEAVDIINAGVSGDTASDGLARLDWSVPDDAEAVVVELGGNDVLRGVDPAVTRKALDALLARLRQRGLPVLLCGMKAPPNMGPEYGRAFERLYGDLAAKYDTLYYPFFLDGVAAERTLNQNDGLHPNAAGVDRIVRGLLPAMHQLVARAKSLRTPR